MTLLVVIILLFIFNCYFAQSNEDNILHNTNVTADPLYDITAPEGIMEDCGIGFAHYASSDLRTFYDANKTAEELLKEGFNITGEDVYGDYLSDFNFTNGTFESTYFREFINAYHVSMGVLARRDVTTYVALLGENTSKGRIEWFCDGILINYQWVLTAAHCLKRNVSVVRLGEVDLETDEPSATEDPQDYGVKKIVIHPDYEYPAVYHDLALIQLSRRTFIARSDINPVCLPWGEHVNDDMFYRDVTLTGWGSTYYTGPSSTKPLEANITIFEMDMCSAYNDARNYREKFPAGLDSELLLCAANILGEGDACQGDSGGPIVYLKENRFHLAGVVATGHGCGAVEYPGIYIPIHRPQYLSWIKRTAFL